MKLLLVFLMFLSNSVYAKKLPLYEFGMAAGAGIISDYPASNQQRTRAIALPTFRYRGKVFRSDRKGTRALFFESQTTNIDLSFGASFPANSEDNEAREGMEDLDWLGEIGPRINILLFKNDKHNIEIELPLRYVFSTDFGFTKHRGYRFVPQIDFQNKFNKNIIQNFSAKMNWATEQLTDYFYQVEGNDIRETREAFDAKGGYLGASLSYFLSYNSNKLFYIMGITYNNYNNATNENSPLFKSKEDNVLFFGINYFFYQSKQLEN